VWKYPSAPQHSLKETEKTEKISRGMGKKSTIESYVCGPPIETGYAEEKGKRIGSVLSRAANASIKAFFEGKSKRPSPHWGRMYNAKTLAIRTFLINTPHNVFTLQSVSRTSLPRPPVVGVKYRWENITRGLRGEWQRPRKVFIQDKVLLYTHGGAYVACSVATHRSMTVSFAKKMGINVFSLDYRLSPQHPYPCAILDSLRAICHLIMNHGYQPSDIVIGGDSAGGNLALATISVLKEFDSGKPLMQILSRKRGGEGVNFSYDPDSDIKEEVEEIEGMMKKGGVQQIAGALLLSPWADLSPEGLKQDDAPHCYLRVPIAPERLVHAHVGKDKDYLASNPIVSPAHADLNGLCPIYLSVGGWELIRTMGVQLIDKLGRTEQSSSHFCKLYPDMVHVFQVCVQLHLRALSTSLSHSCIDAHLCFSLPLLLTSA